MPEADILALADPEDRDGDGISGRANRVWSAAERRVMLGRFGCKAGAAHASATRRRRRSRATSGSRPRSIPRGWGDCTEAQALCRAQPDGGAPEADDQVLDLVTFYSRNLAVPARRDPGDPRCWQGKRVFYEAGCAACHQPKFVTDRLEGQPEQSFQLIWPYTDLLLHDMGEGLADHRPEARGERDASGGRRRSGGSG